MHNDDMQLQLSIEYETRCKSYELRVRGQLNTIKELETKLHEATKLNEFKDKQIETLTNKLKNYEINKNKVSTRTSCDCGGRPSELTAERLKNEQLQTKLEAEQFRRKGVEERSRALRDYLDKAKGQCCLLELQKQQLQDVEAELNAKLSRCRKEYKELATAHALQRPYAEQQHEQLHQYQQQLQQQQTAFERAEEAIRKERATVTTLQAQLQAAYCEVKATLERSRQQAQEVGVQREQISQLTEQTKSLRRRLAQQPAARTSLEQAVDRSIAPLDLTTPPSPPPPVTRTAARGRYSYRLRDDGQDRAASDSELHSGGRESDLGGGYTVGGYWRGRVAKPDPEGRKAVSRVPPSLQDSPPESSPPPEEKRTKLHNNNFDRLQRMYERVVGGAAARWRSSMDSDSD